MVNDIKYGRRRQPTAMAMAGGWLFGCSMFEEAGSSRQNKRARV
jgi:hypothetical protein